MSGTIFPARFYSILSAKMFRANFPSIMDGIFGITIFSALDELRHAFGERKSFQRTVDEQNNMH